MAALRVIFLLSICLASVKAEFHIEEEITHTVCRNVRIWNLSGHNLTTKIEDLQSCEIIEGYLDIRDVYLDPSTSFPKLVQVTDYIVLNYVEGVTSVADLFPRLAVIRGRNLFFNYGLALIDNHDLREIGSWSLKVIKRGAIRLESNAIMCINSRAELDRITDKDYRHRLVLHKNYYLCPFEDCLEENWCSAPERSCKDIGCYEENECHEECLGGCTCYNNASCCAACKHVLLGNKCVMECPKDYLTYMKYRCITTEQCLNYGWAILKNSSNEEVADGRCIKKCPNSFVKRNYTGVCEPRQVNDWCDGATLTNTYFGSGLKGCSVINGNLIIMISEGKNVTRQLEENLAKLENITGYLRVVGASALLSLNFLKSLRNIQGNEVAPDGCVFCIFENSNLEELWNRQSNESKLVINGNPFIAFNDRLCPAKVRKLLNETNLTSDNRVIRSNGKHTDCHVFYTPLTAIAGNSPGTVILRFYHEWCGIDYRTFVGYGVYFRESLKNISKYEGRDICSNEVWKMKFFEIEYMFDEGTCFTSLSLENLKLNTRYAIYAESFAADDVAIHTDIAYVTTYPLRPSAPRNGSIKIVDNNLLISFEETPPSDGSFYEVIVDLKSIEPEKDARYFGSCPDETLATESIARSYEGYEYAGFTSKDSESNCICSPISPESLIMKRKERVAVENEIQGLYHNDNDNDMVEPERKTDSGSTHATLTGNNVKMCMKNKATRQFPNGLCADPILDWAKSENDPLMFTELSETHNWTGVELLTESSLVLESLHSTQSISLPSHVKTPAKIEVKVRACLSKMAPCKQLNISSSCALCSNYFKATTYKVEKHPRLQNFKVSPSVFDEAGKELGAIYTTTDCKSEFIDLPYDVTKNKLKLDITWDYSANNEHLVHGYKIQYTSMKETNSTCISKLSADELENNVQLEVRQPREYKVSLYLKTSSGFELSKEICMDIKVNDIFKELYWMGAIAGFSALVVVILLVSRYFIQKYPMKDGIVECENPYHGEIPDKFLYDHGIYVKFQITTDKIQILKGKELGKGKFGRVYEGYLAVNKNNVERKEEILINESQNIFKYFLTSCNKKNRKKVTKELEMKKVAIKTGRNEDGSDDKMMELIEEAKRSITCNKSEFCVKMFGVYREAKIVYVVYEQMDKNLQEYLLENKENGGLSENTLTEIGIQITDGIDFMRCHGLTHRDIAARNILISTSSSSGSSSGSSISVTAKISDFGLTRRSDDGYYKITSNGKPRSLPVRWMAPESLTRDKYNWQTDVWSFGVLLWEMLHIGMIPYEHIEDDQELYRRRTKQSMHQLECLDAHLKPAFLIELIKKCTQVEPDRRPSCKDTVEKLLPRVREDFRDEFLNLSWYKHHSNSDTNSTEGKDEGVADCSFNASLDEDDQPSSSSTSCQPCDDTSFSSLTQEEYSGKNVSCPSLQFVM